LLSREDEGLVENSRVRLSALLSCAEGPAASALSSFARAGLDTDEGSNEAVTSVEEVFGGSSTI
jgi:hypothetical protein